MLELGLLRYCLIDAVFQRPRIGEVQALVDAQAQQGWIDTDPMPEHVAKMLGASHQTDLGNVRPAGLEQEQGQRHQHASHQTRLDTHTQGNQQGHHHSGKVGLGISPGATQDAQVHQGQHRHHDGRSQRRLRHEIQCRREQQRRQQNAAGREHAGRRRLRARIEVDHRARKATGHRKAAREGRAQIARAQRDRRLAARVWPTDTDSTKPTTLMSSAGTASSCQSARSKDGKLKGGRP